MLTFLDSHCEANVDWLPPVLAPIAAERTTVVTPVIDTINHRTMDYAPWVSRVPAVGTFDWTLDFNWKSGKIKPGDSVTDPVE